MSGGYSISGLGRGRRVPHLRGVSHVWGVPHLPTPITQSSIASTCYMADGVPLAFMQEDFLVIFNFTSSVYVCNNSKIDSENFTKFY